MANGELTPRRPEIAFQISEANPQAGLPAGGDKDYVLRKKTAEDFDVEWDASAVAPNSLEPEQLKADEDGDKASFRDRISAVSKADLENEKAARATQEDAIRDELRSETAARTSGDASLGTRIDSVSQYPQADRDKLSAIGIRDVTGLTISGRNITFSWTDSAGAEQNTQIQIARSAGGSFRFSFLDARCHPSGTRWTVHHGNSLGRGNHRFRFLRRAGPSGIRPRRFRLGKGGNIRRFLGGRFHRSIQDKGWNRQREAVLENQDSSRRAIRLWLH